MGFFDSSVTTNLEGQGIEQSEVEKALSAGYGTDPTTFSGGRALIPEDLEATLTNILSETDTDCKMFASLHKQPVKSTVHEIVRRTGYGDHRFGFIAEGGDPREDSQKLERKLYETKYLATVIKVTKQMELVETLEGAYESEKIAAVNRIALNAEYALFHGDSSVVPTEFDGLEKSIRDYENKGSSDKERSTVADLHGLEIGVTSTDTDLTIKDTGRALFNDLATKVFKKGGDLKRALYAPELNMQFDRLYEDKLRYMTGGSFGMEYLNELPTSIGSTIKIRGTDSGADKLYYVKGEVSAAGDSSKRPFAPSTVTIAANSSASDSHFFSNDAGVYTYAVHAVNEAGISGATSGSTTATVVAGGSVTITITPNSDGPAATGFIITRSAPDGSILMEMVKVPASADSTTVYTDINRYLPGTASMVLLSATESRGRNAISFGQLLPITAVPVATREDMAKRAVVSLYGMLEVRNPEHHALIENIGYNGGLYHN